jgi:antigen flippase
MIANQSISENADPGQREPGQKGVPPDAVASDGKSYGQILKSSTIIGGSSLVNICMGIVRVKVNALLIGPAGVGLFGLYGSITEIATQLSDMGMRSSGVRQIAAAAATGDQLQIARTTKTLRRVVLILGCLGSTGLFLLRKPVSRLTFGSLEHTAEVGVLALVVLFGAISAGQAALLQGMRRIGNLARINIIGAVLGTLLSATIIFYFRERGIVASLIAVGGMTILTSWWYARKITVRQVVVGWTESKAETRHLLSLGLIFAANGLMAAGVAYAIRLLIVHRFGLNAVGLYQSAYALSIVYAGFILEAMGTDFYPRLTAAAKDHGTCNQLVNEQAEIGLLLAVPGILATLTFAPLVIHMFYSARFEPAAGILRWQVLGILMRVATWPMAFILPAKELKQAYFWSEFVYYLAYLALAWICLPIWGLTGVGVAFFGAYLVFWGLTFVLVRRSTGFSWSKANLRLGMVHFPSVLLVFGSFYILPRIPGMVLGASVTLLVGLYNLKIFHRTVGPKAIEFITKRLRQVRQ